MCTPMPPSHGGSLPAMDPYGKVVTAMLRPATLVLMGLASAAAIAHAFWAPFPASGGNPVLDLIAYHDPGFHTVIRVWYYVAPAVAVLLAGSLGLSVWRVWLQPRAGGGRRGTLPPWPASPEDETPSLVIGELHHPVVPRESERPSWLVVPETGAVYRRAHRRRRRLRQDLGLHVSVRPAAPLLAGRLARGAGVLFPIWNRSARAPSIRPHTARRSRLGAHGSADILTAHLPNREVFYSRSCFSSQSCGRPTHRSSSSTDRESIPLPPIPCRSPPPASRRVPAAAGSLSGLSGRSRWQECLARQAPGGL